jgi:hypothetical protein
VRNLIEAMITQRIIAPGSKLAFYRALAPATATSSLALSVGLIDVGYSVSLAKRLFTARVELVGEVDGKAEPISQPEHIGEVKTLRDNVAADLRNEILGMSFDSPASPSLCGEV